MTVVLLRRGEARDATESEDAHLVVVVVVVVAILRSHGLVVVLFIFEDEDEAHAFAKDETAVAARTWCFFVAPLSRGAALRARDVSARTYTSGAFVEEKFAGELPL